MTKPSSDIEIFKESKDKATKLMMIFYEKLVESGIWRSDEAATAHNGRPELNDMYNAARRQFPEKFNDATENQDLSSNSNS
jgi:hypothetical protein